MVIAKKLTSMPTRAVLDDGTIWPLAGEEMRELEWKLRYAPEAITAAERYDIAGIINAYMQTANVTQKRRNSVFSALKQAT